MLIWNHTGRTGENVSNKTLKVGEDFDTVILGISIAALKYICKDIIASNDAWKTMIENVLTVQTQAVQLWFKPSNDDMGELPSEYSMSGYEEPLNSWADFSQVIKAENQSPDRDNHAIAYGTDVLKDDFSELPPPNEHHFPEEQKHRVKQNLLSMLRQQAGNLWPEISDENKTLDWETLVAPPDVEGSQRVDYQYWRANIDPTERYVLSVVGSDQYRLKTDESGYKNLYLVGTWINSGYNMSSVEIATMTGMMASRAISGYPQTIPNELKSTQD